MDCWQGEADQQQITAFVEKFTTQKLLDFPVSSSADRMRQSCKSNVVKVCVCFWKGKKIEKRSASRFPWDKEALKGNKKPHPNTAASLRVSPRRSNPATKRQWKAGAQGPQFPSNGISAPHPSRCSPSGSLWCSQVPMLASKHHPPRAKWKKKNQSSSSQWISEITSQNHQMKIFPLIPFIQSKSLH